MANTIPALPHQPPLVEGAAPRSIVEAGSTDPRHRGRWLDIGKSINLLIATGRAQPICEQWWADGQFVTAGAQTNRGTIPVPYLSEAHTAVAVLVYGASSDSSGFVTFRATLGGGGADEVVVALPAAVDWAEDVLSVFAAAGSEYLHWDTEGNCALRGIAAYVIDLAPTAAYPAADDELDADPVDDATPIDDDEPGEEEAVDAGLLAELRGSLDEIRLRPVVAMAVTGIQETDHRWVGAYPTRQPVLLPRTRSGRVLAKVRALITNDHATDPLDLHIDVGDGGQLALFDALEGEDHPSIVTITAAATSGTDWYELDIELRPRADLQAPPNYAGIALVGCIASVAGDEDLIVRTVTITIEPEAEA